MDGTVAFHAVRHDRRIIISARVVGMEGCVAFTTVKLVLSSFNFKVFEVTGMALPALVDCQWLRIDGIERRVVCGQVGRGLLRRDGGNHPGKGERCSSKQ